LENHEALVWHRKKLHENCKGQFWSFLRQIQQTQERKLDFLFSFFNHDPINTWAKSHLQGCNVSANPRLNVQEVQEKHNNCINRYRTQYELVKVGIAEHSKRSIIIVLQNIYVDLKVIDNQIKVLWVNRNK
jgi:hypothetical protein